MGLPVIAIVGRPNVGKSSLFNALSGARTSIVEATPGVTRDRVSTVTEYDDVYFELVDTGGYGIEDVDDLTEHVERQIHFAIRQATLILFVVDTRDGAVPLDRKMADLLRKEQERVCLIANKTDDPRLEPQAAEFERLGFGPPMCVSALHGFGKTSVRELILERIGDSREAAPGDPVMKVAVVGKRNTGKSTFINALAGEERVIVSEVPGTTRDSIDVRFEIDGRSFLAIDTAGLKKKSKFADSIEFYAFNRAEKSIDRADVALFFIDSTEPISQVDKKLAKMLMESFKPVVLVVNKWDLAKNRASTDDYGDYLAKTMPGLEHAPIVFTSAVQNRNVYAVVDVASALFKQFMTRVSTGKLNQVLKTILSERGPSFKRGGAPPKIFYASQVAVAPPTIVLFVNRPENFAAGYERFLINRFQGMLPFGEIPIKLVLKPRRRMQESERS